VVAHPKLDALAAGRILDVGRSRLVVSATQPNVC
jgi:hypothetical protein